MAGVVEKCACKQDAEHKWAYGFHIWLRFTFNYRRGSGAKVAHPLPWSTRNSLQRIRITSVPMSYIGLLLGGWCGGERAQHLSDATLRRVFAAFLALRPFICGS